MIIPNRQVGFTCVMLIVTIALVSCGSEEDKEPFGFPLATGNTWEYDYRLNSSINHILHDSVGTIQVFNGEEYYRLYRWFNEEKDVTDELVQLWVRSVPDTAFYFLEVDARDNSIINEIPYEITDIDGHSYTYPINLNGNERMALIWTEQVSLEYEGENYTGQLWTRTTESTDDGIFRFYFIPGIGIHSITDNNSTSNSRIDLRSYSLIGE